MTDGQIAGMLDELIEAAKYAVECQVAPEHAGGCQASKSHLRVLELADRELLELREKLLVTLSGAVNGAR